MANKPLSLEQIVTRVEALENELGILKAEVKKLQPKVDKNSEPNIYKVNPSTSNPPTKPKSFLPESLENFLGENLFIKLGLLTMLLGATWFINLAFEEYWINESVRIWLGLIAGLSLTFASLRLMKNWPLIGPAAMGTGISLTFISYFLGYFMYDLYTLTPTFIGLVLLCLVSVGLSYILINEVIFVFGILGAFLVPTLLSTGENSYQFLFTYLLLWNVLFLLISPKTKWRISPILLLIGNHFMFGGWAIDNLSRSSYEYPLFFQVSIFLLFLYREYKLVPALSKKDSLLSFITIGLSLLFVYLQAYYLSSVFFPLFQDALLMSLVVVYFVFFYQGFSRSKGKSELEELHIGGVGLVGLLFVLASIVIGFEGRMLSLASASFALIIGIAGSSAKIRSLYGISLIFWIVTILNLLFDRSIYDNEEWIFLNGYFLLYAFSAAMLYVLSRLGKALLSISEIYKWSAFPVLLIGTFAEIYYHVPSEYQILGYTSVFAVYGLIFTIAGFFLKDNDLRKIGLFALSIVILKLYIYDFWNMGIVARIFAGFGLGAALVFAGILYNRSKKNNLPPKDLT
ncbi:MAG: DUF2339 domain-containing protein [Leptospira sp.]|nr:DUF2339 domain-containing protein [Leptospira sp.]